MATETRHRPTNAELGILRVLWSKGPSTVRTVFEDLGADREIGYTTVLKLMQIMAEKGLLTRVDQGRAHLYAPAMPEQEAKRDLLEDFMDRAFGGSAAALMMHALNSKRAKPEDLAEIRRMLDELEAKGE